MANLAFRGHTNRGREVIEILEMLGGINKYRINFTEENLLYTIREGDNVIIAIYPNSSINKIFTLEDFLVRFPYKVGDKVLVKDYESPVKILKMIWNGSEIEYLINNGYDWMTADELKPYEETMEGKLISNEEMSLKIDISQMEKRQIIFSADAPNKTELVLGDNFEIKVEDGKTYIVKKKPQYPKTYEECCKVMGCCQ